MITLGSELKFPLPATQINKESAKVIDTIDVSLLSLQKTAKSHFSVFERTNQYIRQK